MKDAKRRSAIKNGAQSKQSEKRSKEREIQSKKREKQSKENGIRPKNSATRINQKDVLLGLVCIVVGIVWLLTMRCLPSSKDQQVVIEVEGKVYGTYPIAKNREISVDTAYGHNVVCIENGKVYMKEADCSDGYCKRQGKLLRSDRTIVCLPHRLVVEVR